MPHLQHAFAEWVSPGHPDRLCDVIAESVVDHALRQDPQSLVGVEVALHRDRIFLDGRVAGGDPDAFGQDPERFHPPDSIVRDAYAKAGYDLRWSPAPERLRIELDLCVEALDARERGSRVLSDDQSISVGYACRSQASVHLPVAHFLARDLGRSLFAWRQRAAADVLGPDFKILPHLRVEFPGTERECLRWERLTMSWQHAQGQGFADLYSLILKPLVRRLEELEACGFEGIATTFDPRLLHLNGCGGFQRGGPHGDNGLSGKKLVVDGYGPSVSIGGGALCGKDPHKIDRCGPLRARQLALELVSAGAPEARVSLVWSPGDRAPSHLEAQVADEAGMWSPCAAQGLPSLEWFSIERSVRALNLNSIPWVQAPCEGYVGVPGLSWESGRSLAIPSTYPPRRIAMPSGSRSGAPRHP